MAQAPHSTPLTKSVAAPIYSGIPTDRSVPTLVIDEDTRSKYVGAPAAYAYLAKLRRAAKQSTNSKMAG